MPCKFCDKNVDFVTDDRDPNGVYHGKDDGMISYISGRCQDITTEKVKNYIAERERVRKWSNGA